MHAHDVPAPLARSFHRLEWLTHDISQVKPGNFGGPHPTFINTTVDSYLSISANWNCHQSSPPSPSPDRLHLASKASASTFNPLAAYNSNCYDSMPHWLTLCGDDGTVWSISSLKLSFVRSSEAVCSRDLLSFIYLSVVHVARLVKVLTLLLFVSWWRGAVCLVSTSIVLKTVLGGLFLADDSDSEWTITLTVMGVVEL